jgi:chemotaxis protein methyltransferase CheR
MPQTIADEDITSLLDAIYKEYGYDFREYSHAHITRRIKNRMMLGNFGTVDEIKEKVLREKSFAALLLKDLSITVTEMFRDPAFYLSFREHVVPILQTYPFIKIWHAGCATGEEAYSIAILLHEEGLLQRTTIYATDFNQHALDSAKEGIYPNKLIRDYSQNYRAAGGKESLSDYYVADYNMAIMNQSLKSKIVWANHNLVTDSVFAEVHLILCRNVLIYFNQSLQAKVHQLFYDSLTNGGILCLGNKESLRFSNAAQFYSDMDKQQRIFRKKY